MKITILLIALAVADWAGNEGHAMFAYSLIGVAFAECIYEAYTGSKRRRMAKES